MKEVKIMEQRALEIAVKAVAGARFWLTRMLVQQIKNKGGMYELVFSGIEKIRCV